ncbi:MAG: hypothetical protein A3F54_04150 [Candidatus Kerfeldbacteria bacterium RIFCSPHIGHO2_12_FULL_48_17]|uniref:Uncharacterized protein n=1 Tax=Candidatus Kerfeldbacteria bacterium RIFCSPHIGHO2_12_FULL_48_17 TaxID=1798542 RepID=A0A1G2B8H8_9BACT|nr:MAG: hypothetical protein A3F54_04150 [Candidatus Kerfeldbacteria bacterium RIFCSPHIGHO2_12_FULL_48_17]
MITYQYSPTKDVTAAWQTLKNWHWLRKNRMIFFLPTPVRFFRLFFRQPRPLQITCKENIQLFWVSSGTWGSYELPNSIFICPWGIKDMKSVITHEIAHLKHEDNAGGLSHEDKEKYIASRMTDRL